MMNNYEDRIDDFLDGQLFEEELSLFQEKLKQDPDFRRVVDLQVETREGIVYFGKRTFIDLIKSVDEELDQEGYFATDEEKEILVGLDKLGKKNFADVVSEVDEELSEQAFYGNMEESMAQDKGKVVSIQRRKRLYAVAASIAILIVSALTFWSLPQNSMDLFQKNFLAMSDLVTEEVVKEREEVGFVTNSASLDSLANAMQLYRDGRYLDFISLTTSLLDDEAVGHYRDQILLYRGIAFLENKLYSDAEETFRLCTHPEADWYLILTLLAQDQPDRAKSYFKTLKNPDQKIRELVDEL